MAWAPEEVFEENKEVVEMPMELIKEYQFTLKDIATTITIRLFKMFGSDEIHFTQSHYIKTPTQAGPYITSRPFNDDIGSALSQAVSGFTKHYNKAMAAGHIPKNDWLEPNEYF